MFRNYGVASLVTDKRLRRKASTRVGAMWMVAKTLGDCLNTEDLRRVARRLIPSPFFHHLDGGAEAEYTMRRNTSAFDDVSLLPRGLVDVSSVSTKSKSFGHDVALPFYCFPTVASRFYHPDGEIAVAQAAINGREFRRIRDSLHPDDDHIL